MGAAEESKTTPETPEKTCEKSCEETKRRLKTSLDEEAMKNVFLK
jgi:hypothetical protein